MSNIADHRFQFLLLKSADKRIQFFLSTIARHSIWSSWRRHRLEIENSLSLRISNFSFIRISQCPTPQTIDFNFSQSFPSPNALRADNRFQIFLLLSPPPHRYPRVIASRLAASGRASNFKLSLSLLNLFLRPQIFVRK